MLEDRIRWNEMFAQGRTCGQGAPAEMIAAEISRLPRGRALDLACGAGRNAIFLAENGYEVTAVDISSVGLELARQRAEARNLTIDWVEADLDDYSLVIDSYDVITCINFLDRRLFVEIPKALKAGGAVIYQAVLVEPDGSPSIYRVQPNELLREFLETDLRIMAYHEGDPEGKETATVFAVKQHGRRHGRI